MTASPESRAERASRWVYSGLWGILVRWFRVPPRPPELPTAPGEAANAFKPAEGFLRYLKLWFWVGLLAIDLLIIAGWLGLALAQPVWGGILALPVLALVVLPDVVAYLAIHLRFDTTWYVVSQRSLRIRRGIWVIRETTITFENVQNVVVRQGPVQRLYGIADVHVETAGGGGGTGEKRPGTQGHQGLIEGVANANQIRDLILSRLRQSRAAGLGDEPHHDADRPGWPPAHLEVLREIRDLATRLARH